MYDYPPTYSHSTREHRQPVKDVTPPDHAISMYVGGSKPCPTSPPPFRVYVCIAPGLQRVDVDEFGL